MAVLEVRRVGDAGSGRQPVGEPDSLVSQACAVVRTDVVAGDGDGEHDRGGSPGTRAGS